MNVVLKSAFAAAVLAVSFAASATDDGRHRDGRFDGHVTVQPHHDRFDGGPRQGVDGRQARQEWRIRQAWHRGDLTRREFRMLRAEQQEIARYESQARADGRLAPHEWRRLDAMLDRADLHIRRFSRDDDARWGG